MAAVRRAYPSHIKKQNSIVTPIDTPPSQVLRGTMPWLLGANHDKNNVCCRMHTHMRVFRNANWKMVAVVLLPDLSHLCMRFADGEWRIELYAAIHAHKGASDNHNLDSGSRSRQTDFSTSVKESLRAERKDGVPTSHPKCQGLTYPGPLNQCLCPCVLFGHDIRIEAWLKT